MLWAQETLCHICIIGMEKSFTIAFINYIHATESRIPDTTKALTKEDYKAAMPLKPLTHNIRAEPVLHWPADFIEEYPQWMLLILVTSNAMD